MDTKLSLEGQHFYVLHPNKLSEMGETEVALQPTLWEFCLTLVLPRYCILQVSPTMQEKILPTYRSSFSWHRAGLNLPDSGGVQCERK